MDTLKYGGPRGFCLSSRGTQSSCEVFLLFPSLDVSSVLEPLRPLLVWQEGQTPLVP